MKKILIITATVTEYNAVQEFIKTHFPNKPITVKRIGIGKVNAAISTLAALQKDQYECVINFGYAGHLSGDLKGEKAFEVRVVTQFDCWESSKEIRELTDTQRWLSTSSKEGVTLITQDHFSTEEDLNEVKSHFPELSNEIILADMEGYAVLSACNAAEVPEVRLIKEVSDSGSYEEYEEVIEKGEPLEEAFKLLHAILAKKVDELPDSFKVDHTKLKPGIYLSRSDVVSSLGDRIDTWDIRLKTPNSGDYLDPKVAHTFEHYLATYMRRVFGNSIIYCGMMGCMTGAYVLTKGLTQQDIYCHLGVLCRDIIASDSIPGCSEKECGNYLFMDLEGCKALCEEILKELDSFEFIYP